LIVLVWLLFYSKLKKIRHDIKNLKVMDSKRVLVSSEDLGKVGLFTNVGTVKRELL